MKIIENNTSVNPCTLTYAELKKLVPSTTGQKLPTAKRLKETGQILFSVQDGATLITIYQNGFLAFTQPDETAKLRTTVFAVDRASQIIYGSKVWHSNDPYRKVVWQCNAKYEGEKKCSTPTITESDVMKAFEKMLRQMDKQAQISNLREIYADVMEFEGLEQEKKKLEAERDAVGEKYRQEIEKNARVAQNQDEYKKREAELAEEYNRVDAEVKAVEAEIQKRQSCGRRIEGLIAALETADEDFTESLWGNMVEKVTVFEDRLVFTLTSGEEVRV